MEPVNAIIIALITSFVIGTLMAFHEATNMLERRCVEASCQNTKDTFNMALVAQGIAPQYIDSQLRQFSLLTSPATTKTLKPLQIDGKTNLNHLHFESISGKTAFGLSINLNDSAGYKAHNSKLNPPDILLSGELKEEWVPLKNIIQPALENPSGTFFRYTLDDSEPTTDSPLWDNAGFTVEAIPQKINFRAFHADLIYAPSDVISTEFSFPTPVIQVTREQGGASLGVSFSEINTNTNRIVLTTDKHPALFKISYKIASESNWTDYTAPFHVPLKFWSEKGVEINIKAESKAAAILAMATETIVLTPIKAQLKPPTFSPTSGSNVISKKDTITINKNNPQGALRVATDGYPDANSSSESTIKVSL